MGEAQNKRKRFLASHPKCCFCGGTEPATTVDHIPARTCFPERAGPEGFEFPACENCQGASRLDELAFAMFVRVNDPSNDNYRRDEIRKSYSGIKNNLPHLLPFTGLSKSAKRRALRDKGLKKPPNVLIDDVPLVGVPAAIDEYIHRYARKMAAALYYREKGKPIGRDFVIWSHWAQAVDKRQMEGLMKVAKMSPFMTVGGRSNLNFGDRFGYRYDMSDENDLFTAVAQFGQGLVVTMLVADGESAKELEGEEGWVRASTMFD